jgi:hypothetical protein
MASPTQTVASAGQSAGRAVGGAIGGAGDFVGRATARTREEAEDVFAEAKNVARKDSGRDAAVYVGLAATAALGALELPVAAALGAGYAIFRRRR